MKLRNSVLYFALLLGSSALPQTVSDLNPALISTSASAENAVKYTSSPEIIQSQKEFAADRFGIFLHWGIYSMFGQGEWYLNYGPSAEEYAKAAKGFYPADFDAKAWVKAFKDATGRDASKANWDSYYNFMDNQLTELLTNYGPIRAIWFDGWWDHDEDPTPFNWQLDEQYALIHRLQPGYLVANNHHQTPFPGENIQIFERELPGENAILMPGNLKIKKAMEFASGKPVKFSNQGQHTLISLPSEIDPVDFIIECKL